MNDAIRALIAGLGAGATSLGTSIGARDEAKRADAIRQAAADKAFQQLLASKDYEASIAPPTTRVVEDGMDPVTNAPREKYQQFNRTTQQWEDAVDTTPTPSAPPAPPQAGMHPAIAALAGKMVPDRVPPITSAIPGNPAAPAPPTSSAPVVQPDRPTPRVLRPPPKAAPAGRRVKVVQPDGSVIFVDPEAPPPGLKERAAIAAPQLQEVTDASGQKHLEPKVAGLVTAPPADSAKAKQTPALLIATMNRLGLSEGDISSAINEMEAFENDPTKRAKLTAYQQALAATANTHQSNEGKGGVLDVVSKGAGSLVSGMAQKAVDPDIRTYLRNSQIVGTAATEILPRPNQALLGIESGLSGIDVGWNPQLLAGVQDRRRRMRDMLHASLMSTPLGQAATKGAPSAKTPPTKAQQLWDAAVAKHGEATVLKEFGPRPPS
jgi:hypothetical protein